MPDWLDISVTAVNDSSIVAMALQLGTAFVCGCVIAGIYRLVRPRQPSMASFPATIVLLAILCAMLPLVIGENVAWAFGLVGALSIVRFRTVVDDTHDITFVIFAVLVGMAVGADRLNVACVGIAVTGLAAFLVRPKTSAAKSKIKDADCKLIIRLGVGREADTVLSSVFEKFLALHEFVAGSTSRQGASIDLTYQIQLRDDASPTALIDQLNRIEGVQSVELRRNR